MNDIAELKCREFSTPQELCDFVNEIVSFNIQQIFCEGDKLILFYWE